MAVENTKYSVEPFNGKNFSLWSRRVEAVFAAKELDVYLERESDAKKEGDVRAAKKAYALLITLLDDAILAALANEKSAFEIWKTLKSKYAKTSAVSQILARKKLATMKKRSDSSMQQHIDEMLGTVNDLRMSGAAVQDMDVVIYLMMSLPAEYDVVKATIENQPSENLTLNFVTQRLLSAEALKGDKNSEQSRNPGSCENVAFRVNKYNVSCYRCKQKGHIAKNCKSKITCYNCGRPGHFKRDCRVKPKSDNRESAATAVTFMMGQSDNNLFLLDSGASAHMCSRGEWFDDLKTFSGSVACASKSDILKIEGIGNISGTLHGKNIVLTDVLYVPDLNGELISVKNIQKAGYSVIFQNNKAIVQKGKECFVMAQLNEKGYYISEFKPIKAAVYIAEHTTDLWHRRMGHSSNKVLQQMGLPTSDNFCEECVIAKHSNEPMGKGPRSREIQSMRMVHTDICGPISPPTIAGEKYFVTIIDDHSRFCEVHLLKHKNDIVPVFKLFIKQNPNLYKIRCDNAKEYVSGELAQCCKEAGILLDPSPPYSAYLNGVSERANRYLLEKARALVYEAKLSKDFWGFAVQTAAYLKNRMPAQSINNTMPFELKYGKLPDLNLIKVFGCDAYMRIPDNIRKKLDPKSRKMIFVGYSSMGYRLLDPDTNRLIISCNVKFNEEKKRIGVTDIDQESVHLEVETAQCDDIVPESSDAESAIPEENEMVKPKRSIKAPARLDDYHLYKALVANLDSILFEDLEKLPINEQNLWRKAMDQEMDSLNKNKVWELVELPKDETPISCKWIFRIKRNDVYKARLVARGFEQKAGIDFFETYAPVINISSLRLILAIILQKELKMFALDVKTAFLNGELNETIFMEQPMGYNDDSGRVCKLVKSLYGLKQAPRQWFEKFTDFIIHLKFQQLNNEPCVFVKRSDHSEVIIVLYVDDLLIAGSDIPEVKVVIQLLQQKFEMSKSEIANEFLGIYFEKSTDRLYLSQKAYVLKILDKFKMTDCKPSDTPLVPKTTASDFDNSEHFNGPYRELIGALLYLAMITRPDILYSVNCLGQMQE